MIRNTNGQPDEGIQRTRAGRLLNTRASALWKVYHTLSIWIFKELETQQTLLGFLWRFYYTDMMDY